MALLSSAALRLLQTDTSAIAGRNPATAALRVALIDQQVRQPVKPLQSRSVCRLTPQLLCAGAAAQERRSLCARRAREHCDPGQHRSL